MEPRSEIDRLIEEGLARYGQGDLDGALLAWEQVLVIEPTNDQASSYVDYVRANYELLTSDAPEGDDAPYGIADGEPDYQIEILPGEHISPASPRPPLYMDPLDEGWSIEADERPADGTLTNARVDPLDGQSTISRRGPPDLELGDATHGALDGGAADLGLPDPANVAQSRTVSDSLTLELETDEPPLAPIGEVSFESPTREYESTSRVVAEFRAEETPALAMPITPSTLADPQPAGPIEFDSITSVQPRNRGFVRPTGNPPTRSESSDDQPTLERGMPGVTSSADLLDSLPLPTRASAQAGDAATSRGPAPRPPDPAAPVTGVSTRDYPSEPRPPAASITSSIPIVRPPTEEGEPEELELPLTSTSPTRDLSDDAVDLDSSEFQRTVAQLGRSRDQPREMPTGRLPALVRPPADPPPRYDSPLISAPTRDLGLRAQSLVTADDNTATGLHVPVTTPSLPGDPLEAQSQEILALVDAEAPGDEAKEDATRRRIQALFEHAAGWSRDGELERAVLAVDLAMSEDPNSALAQKLIHRNRDTTIAVLQAYLGDMNRTPELARPLHQLGGTPINPRAAFLLSRIDGLLSLEEVLDVSGMPRIEALRYLCQLFLRGILR